MAHEIIFDEIRNINPIAFVGETPWHGLGQQLPADAPMEVWAKQAGMDFNINSTDTLYALPTPTQSGGTRVTNFKFPRRKILYREDSNAPLSIVGHNYNVVQPTEVLEFFTDLVKTAGFKMNTAGVLYGGTKYWALAEIGAEARIMGQDAINGFLLLATACDGSLATTAQFTSIRVVCNNTLSFAVEGESQGALKIPHSKIFDPDAVKAELGLASVSFNAFIEKANVLAKRKVSDKEALDWLVRVFNKIDDDQEIDLDVMGDDITGARNIKNCLELFKGAGKGSNLKSADGTAWGLVNSVTEWADFKRNTRSPDANLNNTWFGEVAGIKQKAFDKILKFAA